MCRVAVHECGNFYSIVWYEVTLYSVICSHCIIFLILYYLVRYRETGSREAQAGQERVYVYRHHSGVTKVGTVTLLMAWQFNDNEAITGLRLVQAT